MMHEFTTGVSKGNIFQECGSWAPVEIDGQTVSSSSCIIELAECLLFMRKATLNVHDTSLCSGMINLLLPWAVCSSLREHHTAHAAMSLRDGKTRANLHLQGGVVSLPIAQGRSWLSQDVGHRVGGNGPPWAAG